MRCPVCHRRLAPGAACPVNGVAAGSGLPLEPLAIPDVPGLSGAALLGVGGFAHVFTAVRESDGREVALKVGLGPHHARFAHEAEALRRVGPPTVPEVLEEGRVGGRPFLVQELLRGQTLAAWMAALPGTGAASVARVRELLTGLCLAVGRVHAVGIAHRDLKPENIFLREGGALSLLDFGLARWMDAGPAEEAGNRAGTTVYMAPEQCLDAREAGPAADIYALGVLLFELITGTPPFHGTPDEVREGHVSQRPPRVSERAQVPGALDAVVARCLAKEPAERYASAEELLAAFEAACAEGPSLPGVVGARDARSAQALVTFAGARPVAVLGLRTAASVEGLAATLEPFGGVLARVSAGGYLLVFCESLSAEANVRAGALAARRLVESGEASAVLHVAVLYVHPGTTLPRIAGAALERPETWWGRALAQGEVRVTPEAVARLEPGWIEPVTRQDDSDAEPVSRESTHSQAAAGGERASIQTAGIHEVTVPQSAAESARAASPGPVDAERENGAVFRLRLHDEDGARADGEPPPFVGRDALLDALVADAARSLSSSAPGLGVLTGEVGHGKSRLLKALALQLESTGHARVVRLRAPPPDASLSNALLDSLRAVVGRPSAEPRILAEALVAQAREAPLVLLLDDAHLADPLSLDVLERATLEGPRASLWICVAGRPSLLGLRPHLGERSAHVSRHTLPPLPPEASRAVLVHLLRPAEHIPEPVLARLEQLAQGVPLSLVELARALRAAGALRSAPGGGWYVAPDALLDVSVTPLFERLAPRVLAGLPEAHRVLARLCAVLGTEVDVARVDAALRHLTVGPELSRAAALDAGAGLQRLTRAGLLRPTSPGRFAFRHPLLREALEALLPPAPRRALHAAALKASVGDDVAERRRRAHHAAVCGAHQEASRDYLSLAEEARSGHLPVEAEQHYTRALALLPESDDARRAQALAGRGKVRHRLQRFRESLADLSAARALARTRGDAALEVDLLLEEATARDWMEDSDGSAACTREALDAIEPLDAPRLSLRCGLARGRLHVRQGEWAAAARVLTSTAEGSERARDHETLVVSLALLGAALTFLDRAPEAAERFDEALERCEAAGDGLHKAAVLSNRVLLWLRQGDVSRMEADLRRAMVLGRELAHAQMERWSTFNLAEVLYMQGRLDEALPLAQRAHELGVRFFREHPVPVDALLLARIQAAAGDEAAAARQLAWISERCPPESLPPTAIMRRLVELQVHQQSTGAFRATDWAALHTEADALASPDEKAEILLQATAIARRTGAMEEAFAWLERAGPAVAEAPLWSTRFHALRAALAPPAL
ncbi:serine/threonine-protein kinase PknK [Corallococcus sp. AB032C]|uniref:serine/threonine-protein kinase n=1 Tax=Corallococcus TaxID=83461 RepID=UPI000EE32965|nr:MULTISPECIES: serine/threonine-protein kinase [Corallococcus]NPC50890.1 protein kinase [Corallococcus exiguus]RKH85229.1 serine/threonine-protein kinase PknK [Corallococcus sp. AB032C]